MITALRDRIRFRVFTTCTDPDLPSVDEIDGIPVHRVYVDLARGSTKLTAAIHALQYFRRYHRTFDIVHLHGFSQKSVLIVMLALLHRKKIVLTIHTAEHDEAGEARRRGRLAYWAYRQAHLYIAISSRIASNYLAAGLPEARLRLASNGIDVARFHPPSRAERDAARAALGLTSPDICWILFVGFFSKEKAPDVLFNAWLAMQAEAPPSGLLFVGATKSDYREVDERLASEISERAGSLGLSDKVRFTGQVANVEQAYHAADIFVMPSRREAFGMALVEAMASALPVVASKIDGVTDEIVAHEHTGLLVPPGDAGALADAIRRLAVDAAAAAAMGARARASVARNYALDVARQRWVEAYEALS
jgi:glycosyltransferase involved in cell wall biosynthesis